MCNSVSICFVSHRKYDNVRFIHSSFGVEKKYLKENLFLREKRSEQNMKNYSKDCSHQIEGGTISQ